MLPGVDGEYLAAVELGRARGLALRISEEHQAQRREREQAEAARDPDAAGKVREHREEEGRRRNSSDALTTSERG